MRSTVIFVSIGLALNACSSEPAKVDGEPVSDQSFTLTPPAEVAAAHMKSHVDSLVDRFDAQPCSDAQVLEFGGKQRDVGHEVKRLYSADRECLTSVKAEMQSLGFNAEGNNTYVARRDHGWVERVALNFDETAQTETIQWTEVIP